MNRRTAIRLLTGLRANMDEYSMWVKHLRLSERAFAVLLVLAALGAYAPVYRAGFVWDDDDYLTENPTVTVPSGLVQIWFDPAANIQYYPLYFTTFWIEYRLWGPNPLGYHAVNVGLHILNALLCWRLLRRLGVPFAWWAAAVFALHPINVESVAWVTERRNVLSAFFALFSTLAFVHFRMPAPMPGDARPRWGLYAAALAAFVAALLSKTAIVTLPAVFLVMVWWRLGRIAARDVVLVLPFLAAGLALAGMTWHLESRGIAARSVGEVMRWTPVERFVLAGRAVWFYVASILWPVQLTHVYPRWAIGVTPAQLLAPLGAVATLVALALLRSRLGRAPLAAALIFGGLLLPALGFVNFGFMQFSLVADRFVYLPAIAIIALLAGSAGHVLRHRSTRTQIVSTLLGAAVLGALGLGTFRQSGIYRDAETLWRDTLAKNPDSWVARLGLASAYIKQGRSDDAIPLLEGVVAARPDIPAPYSNLAEAMVRSGRDEEALVRLRAAHERFPDDANLLFNLAVLSQRTGREVEALQHYRRAIELDPRPVEAVRRFVGLLVKRAETLQKGGLKHDAGELLREGLERARRHGLNDLALELEARLRAVRGGAP